MTRRAAALLAATLAVGGCARDYTMLAPRPPAAYERLGRVEGVGCGSSWLLLPFDNTAEFGYRGRIERARAAALAQKPGATALLDVSVQEHTTWWLIGVTECVTVRGDAIR